MNFYKIGVKFILGFRKSVNMYLNIFFKILLMFLFRQSCFFFVVFELHQYKQFTICFSSVIIVE